LYGETRLLKLHQLYSWWTLSQFTSVHHSTFKHPKYVEVCYQ